MSSETAHSFTQHAAHRFSDSDLRKHAQGATYVKFNDMIARHLFETSFNQNITVVDDRLTRNTRQLKQLLVKRSWSTRINSHPVNAPYMAQVCNAYFFRLRNGWGWSSGIASVPPLARRRFETVCNDFFIFALALIAEIPT